MPAKANGQGENADSDGAGQQSGIVSLCDVITGVAKAQESLIAKYNHAGGNNNSHSHSTEWKKVKHTKPNSEGRVGTGSEKTSIAPKGVKRFIDLDMYRIEPNTSVECLKGYLKPHFSEVVCESLAAKYPEEYVYFKVRIHEDNLTSAMNADLWSANTCVFYACGG